MIHVTKQLDFTEGPLCINLVIKRIRNLLDGNVLIRLRVQSRAVHTKTTQKTTQNFSIFHSQKKKKKITYFPQNFQKKYATESKEKKKKKKKANLGLDLIRKGGKAKRVSEYQTMPYAPFPMGMMGGLYLAVTSNMLPNMLYWMNLPPWLSVAGIFSIPIATGGCCGGGAASDITVSAGGAAPPPSIALLFSSFFLLSV